VHGKIILATSDIVMTLPQKITPCPIIEAVVEIRFSSSIPPDAIFGLVYESFKDIFPSKPIDLPILQLPAQIRNADPNLIYQAHYRFSHNGFLLQIGPKTISVINKDEYVGWAAFSLKIKECFNKMKSINVIEKTKRFGLRYINFFEGQNIFDKLNLEISIDGKTIIGDETYLSSIKKTEDFVSNLKLSNSSKMERKGKETQGSLIDIDIFCEENGNTIYDNLDDILEKAHDAEKVIFFGLLKEAFLKELNPEY